MALRFCLYLQTITVHGIRFQRLYATRCGEGTLMPKKVRRQIRANLLMAISQHIMIYFGRIYAFSTRLGRFDRFSQTPNPPLRFLSLGCELSRCLGEERAEIRLRLHHIAHNSLRFLKVPSPGRRSHCIALHIVPRLMQD
jgi:hypothetical protein